MPPVLSKIPTDCTISSHGLKKHFLPDMIENEFDYSIQGKFRQPNIDAWPGRRLNHTIVERIKRKIRNHSLEGLPQLQILMLGSVGMKISRIYFQIINFLGQF